MDDLSRLSAALLVIMAAQRTLQISSMNASALKMNSRRWRILFMALVALVGCILNAMAAVHSDPVIAGRTRFDPWIWEGTSFITLIAAAALLIPFVGRTRGHSDFTELFARLAGAFVAFAAIHVGGFIILRKALFAMIGRRYDFGGIAPLTYELPRELLAFTLFVLVIWFWDYALERVRSRAPAGAVSRPSTMVIRDGSRTLQMSPDEVIAVRAAGNYVELHLIGRRTELVRSTLTNMEEHAQGSLVQVHRSWLINPAHVREFGPARTRRKAALLKDGLEVPLSSRFASALSPLRAAPSSGREPSAGERLQV